MQLSYGGYAHDDNEVWLDIHKKAVFGPTGAREKVVERWVINGVLISDTAASLSSKISDLDAAYGQNDQDLTFGGTAHSIVSSNTINGVRVQSLEWLPGNPGVWGSGTEYVNKRSYRIVVTAETLYPEWDLYLYQSSVSVTGNCGPRQIMMPSLIGYPQQQIPQLHTTQKIVQSGMAIGLTTRPSPDGPWYNTQYEQNEMRRITELWPMELGKHKNLKFPVRWSYFYEFPYPEIPI